MYYGATISRVLSGTHGRGELHFYHGLG